MKGDRFLQGDLQKFHSINPIDVPVLTSGSSINDVTNVLTIFVTSCHNLLDPTPRKAAVLKLGVAFL